tara:strand:- start:7220 stop:7387 length:168 start_codon:yes stop_codon:yes gene_type:complete
MNTAFNLEELMQLNECVLECRKLTKQSDYAEQADRLTAKLDELIQTAKEEQGIDY